MSKVKTLFFCQNCGAQSSKWVGKCASCGEWNTYVEEVVQRKSNGTAQTTAGKSSAKPIGEIKTTTDERILLSDLELNRVLGGGVMPGSVILLGGEPGIGKSTLLLQIALHTNGLKVLYVSGEESEKQIKLRGDRVNPDNPACFVLTETATQSIFHHIEQVQPELIIVDSIQTLYSARIESSAGSISQIRECTAELIQFSKTSSIPVFIIGHITKEGAIAGPKVLEHMVDVVLQFEGERNHLYRVLRSLKNRYGSTHELGLYEMQAKGLVEVTNPSQVLIGKNKDSLSGVAVAVTIEGMRPLLLEIQGLVSPAVYGTPQRSSTGFDARRLNMLLAVLEKRSGFKLSAKDVFLNVTGGIRIDDPASDLAVAIAIISSSEDIPVPPNWCFAGEIGLTGEIRVVGKAEQRIKEAERLGFEKIILSKHINGVEQKDYDIELTKVGTVEQLLGAVFS